MESKSNGEPELQRGTILIKGTLKNIFSSAVILTDWQTWIIFTMVTPPYLDTPPLHIVVHNMHYQIPALKQGKINGAYWEANSLGTQRPNSLTGIANVSTYVIDIELW